MSNSGGGGRDDDDHQNKVASFRTVFESSLSDIAARTDPATRCIVLSGGVDTCAILSAARELGIAFGGALTVITGDDSPDGGFSAACAAEHGIPHHVVRLTSDELVAQYLPEVVELLRIYNGMLIRNSLVIAAVFKKAAELGFKDAVVGDGADELFGGYSFMWAHKDPAAWREKRDSMCAKWTFSTEELAGKYGIASHSPYCETKTKDWAIANTERWDCIGTRPIRLVYGGEFAELETGKIILREAYDTVSSWRRKDPIEVGSGVTVIGHDPYWKERISDDEFESESKSLLERGYIIDRKEQLANFRAFEEIFGTDGIECGRKRLSIGRGCVGCCFEIGDALFCHMCGAYPAQRSVVEGTAVDADADAAESG